MARDFALSFGISKSNADAVITMDADGSHPFEVIKLMIDENQKGYNVVQGHRVVYDRDKRFRKYFSYIFNSIFSLISGVNLLKQNVHFRLMDRKAVNLFINNKRSGIVHFIIDYTNFNFNCNYLIKFFN